LKWEQCHQHNHSEGFELNPGQWQHLSVQSRICVCHCYKGSTEGDSGGSFCFKPLLGATSSEILSPSMRRYYRHPVYMVWMTSLKYCGVLNFCKCLQSFSLGTLS
jgi:hypothetical protein